MRSERSILHFNVADFAVAVERIEDTTLRQKPLIIGGCEGGNRAVVYDMSDEAFKCGVQKGMKLFRARRMCRDATVLAPRPLKYQRAMQTLLQEVKRYSPLIEHGTLDGHMFVDVTGTHRLFGPAPDVGWRVRKNIRGSVGLDPIWTLASNKLVSKVASRLVKPVGEYIVGAGEEEEFLAPLPVKLLPGVNLRERERLREFNIVKIGHLAALQRQQLMVPFGKRSDYLYDISHGIDNSEVTGGVHETAPVCFEHDFSEETNDGKVVKNHIFSLIQKAGRELRRRNQAARRVGVWVMYADGSRNVRQATRRQGTSSDFALKSMALLALQRAWTRRTRLCSCKLVCDRLHRESPQLLLFPGKVHGSKRKEKVLMAMDSIRDRFGESLVRVGG
jgi:DNA polymerase IV